ncbi:MAG: HU family DNA-binding protein [Clostridia bacterium]|nr:HU family DNA-binding protein [Clostridia bacterium]
MNKAELAAVVAYKTGLTKKDSVSAVNAVFDAILETVCEGDRVNVKGFGSFELKKKNARKARNPLTKETIDLPETVVPAFKPGERFKNVAVKNEISEE